MHEWASTGQHELLERGARDLRAQVARRADEAPPEDRRARREARRPRGTASDFEEADRLRAEIEAAGWEMRDRSRRLPAPPQAVTADLVYGRRAVREALRGRREVLELWTTERALKAEPWLAESRRAGEVAAGARADRARGHARPPGRGRARRAVPLRRRLRAGRGRAAAARGARPGHRPAQPRRGLPQRRRSGGDGRRRARARLGGRHAGGRALVGRRDRAPRRSPSSRTSRGTSRR